VSRRNVPGTIYLLHFDRPFHHARHYVGWTERDVSERIAEHSAGRGACLLSAISAAGIGFSVARTWPGTRHDVRALKAKKATPRLCPICQAK
jgi:hypothetical protein